MPGRDLADQRDVVHGEAGSREEVSGSKWTWMAGALTILREVVTLEDGQVRCTVAEEANPLPRRSPAPTADAR